MLYNAILECDVSKARIGQHIDGFIYEDTGEKPFKDGEYIISSKPVMDIIHTGGGIYIYTRNKVFKVRQDVKR